MRTLTADRKMPNTGGWQDRHDSAVTVPNIFERGVVQMLKGWQQYAEHYRNTYEAPIGDDGVLGAYWESMGDALRGILNGETGRLDCGTLDGFILDTMKENGIETENK